MTTERVLRDLAPTAASALSSVEQAPWTVEPVDEFDLLARVAAVQHGLVPLARPVTAGAGPWADRAAGDWRSFDDLDETQRCSLSFTEQFAVDVSSITDIDRADAGQMLGRRLGTIAQLDYVADMVPRVHRAIRGLFPDASGSTDQSDLSELAGSDRAGSDPAEPVGLWPAIDEFIRVVAQLDALDPITTEVVRLRGARQHQCRSCQSLRSRSALLAGADGDMFAAIDSYQDGALSDRHRAALALVDAMIWTPAHLDDSLLADVRQHFSDQEQVELVLDVMRNGANKIAVSLGVDGARTEEGYEIYDIGSDGNPVYGLSLA